MLVVAAVVSMDPFQTIIQAAVGSITENNVKSSQILFSIEKVSVDYSPHSEILVVGGAVVA